MYSIEVEITSLRAALLGAAKQDVRYYLNGVLFDVPHRLLVATTGHYLVAIGGPTGDAICRPRIGTDEKGAPVFGDLPTACPEFIMPREACETLIKAAKACRVTTIALEVDDWLPVDTSLHLPVKSVSACIAGCAYHFKPIDGTFPDWRRVVPTKISNVPAQFDPAHVKTLSEVSKLMGSRNGVVHIHHNGASAAIVRISASAMGVLTPFRSDGESAQQALAVVGITEDSAAIATEGKAKAA